MTRSIAVVLVGSVLALVGCKPKSQRDRASYSIGAQFGKSLRSQNLDLATGPLCDGLKAGYGDKKLALSQDEMQSAMLKLSEDRQKQMHAEADKNKGTADAFLAKNKEQEGVKVTASGLQYKITDPGTGASPKPDDTVVVNYKGTLIDGTEFDSSYKHHVPAEFPLKGVIPGWTEGLQLLKKGGKATFWIPPQLAYGDRPRQNIPANSVLVFEVELLDIKPPVKTKGKNPAAKPHPGARK